MCPPPDYNGSSTSAWNITGSGPWLLAFMLTIIILMTICGNMLLIALVFAHRSLRCTSNCFLVSLFFSDLMVALVVMPPAMLNVLCGAWVLWPAFCPVWLCFDVMCCSASILNLCLISLDRYLFIISPLRYKQRMTPPRALILVGAAWGLAALASFLPIQMKWHSLGHRSGLSFQCRLRVTLPFALVASVLTFFLPSSAICFTYCRILLVARRQAKRVAALTGQAQLRICIIPTCPQPSVNSERRLAHRQGRRALKASLTLGVLLGLFFSAWLPFFITNMAEAVCECVPLALFDAITWLGYCNSTINPIIYPLFMRDFKRALGKLLPCCSSRSPRRPSPPSRLKYEVNFSAVTFCCLILYRLMSPADLKYQGYPNRQQSPPSLPTLWHLCFVASQASQCGFVSRPLVAHWWFGQRCPPSPLPLLHIEELQKRFPALL
uniref:G-protein coupled receptors family 1 profile domain-containing protein n=1 Tax=Astatotilapia calliptera TaxID=8154 RepID=A0A3P8PR79_ASTCA